MDSNVRDEVFLLYQKGWTYEKIAEKFDLDVKEVEEEIEKEKNEIRTLREAAEEKKEEELDREIDEKAAIIKTRNGRM